MNIHPFLVHFPIAMFVVYSIFELLRFRILISQSWWFYVKASFLIVGVLGAFAALSTGEIAEDLLEGINPRVTQIVDVHAFFAGITTFLFSVLAIAYLSEFLRRIKPESKKINKCAKLSAFIIKSPVVIIISLSGLVLVLITGALGAAMAHGVDVDLFVKFIYNLIINDSSAIQD